MNRLTKQYGMLVMAGLVAIQPVTQATVDANYSSGAAYGNYASSSNYEDDFYEDAVNNENNNSTTNKEEEESDYVDTPASNNSNNTTDYDPTYNSGYSDWVDEDSNIIEDIEGENIDYDSIFIPTEDTDTTDTNNNVDYDNSQNTQVDDRIDSTVAQSPKAMDMIGNFVGPKYMIDRLKHLEVTGYLPSKDETMSVTKEGQKFRVNGIELDEYTFNTSIVLSFIETNTDLNTIIPIPGDVKLDAEYAKGTVHNFGDVKIEPKEFNAYVYIGREADDLESTYKITSVHTDKETIEFDWNEETDILNLYNISSTSLGKELTVDVNNGTRLTINIPDTVGYSWTPETSVNLGSLNFNGITDTVDVTIIDDKGQLVPDGYVDVYQGKLLLTTSRFTGGKVKLRMYPMSAYGNVEIKVRAEGFEAEPHTLDMEIGKHEYKSTVSILNKTDVVNKDTYLELQEFDIESNGVLRGTVKVGNIPISNAIVKNVLTNERYRTDKNGAFELAVTPGKYTMGILKSHLNGIDTKELKMTFEFKEDYVEEVVEVETVPTKQPMDLTFILVAVGVSLGVIALVAFLLLKVLKKKKGNADDKVDLDAVDTEYVAMLEDNDTLDLDVDNDELDLSIEGIDQEELDTDLEMDNELEDSSVDLEKDAEIDSDLDLEFDTDTLDEEESLLGDTEEFDLDDNEFSVGTEETEDDDFLFDTEDDNDTHNDGEIPEEEDKTTVQDLSLIHI